MDYIDERLQRLEGFIENVAKAVNSLIVANGAGLVACLATLKDYESTPSFKGIGLFIGLFGVGLLSAIICYSTIFFLRMQIIDLADRDPSPRSQIPLFVFGVSSIVSASAFGVAIILIVAKFYRL